MQDQLYQMKSVIFRQAGGIFKCFLQSRTEDKESSLEHGMKSINMCHSRKHPISCVQDRRPQRESVPLIRNDLGLAMTAPMNTFLIISTEAFPVGLCRYTYRFIYVQCSLVNILQKAFSHKTLFPSVPVFFISTLPQ